MLPAGTYDIEVQLTDGTPVAALSPGSTTIPAAKSIVVYAVGWPPTAPSRSGWCSRCSTSR